MMRRVWWSLLSVVGMLVCYHLPWYVHDSAGFTMHAYDLAEWASLHPAVRSSSPAMLTSFLLRAPLWALVAVLALVGNRFDDPRWRWTVRAAALILALRFVPPQEFFTGSRDDPNYRQMALLTGLSVLSVLGALVVSRTSRLVNDSLLAVMLALGMFSGWWGLSRTYELLENFAIDVQVGVGAIGYTAFGVVVLLVVAIDMLRWATYRTTSRKAQAAQRARAIPTV